MIKTIFISPIKYILSKGVKNVGDREKNNTSLIFRNLMLRLRSRKFMQTHRSTQAVCEHRVWAEAGRASGREVVCLSLSLKLGTSPTISSDSAVREQKGLIICCDEVVKERNYNYREGWVRKKWGRTVLVWSKQVSETISVLVNTWAKTHHQRMKMPKGVAPTHLDPQDRAVHAEGRRGSSVILWEHQSQATGTISKVTC